MRFRASMEHADPENVFKMTAVRDGGRNHERLWSVQWKKRHNNK